MFRVVVPQKKLEGDNRECWAECQHERFTLHFPEQLV